MGIECFENTRREVQAGCWSSNTALYFRIDGLIGGFITLLRLTIQIGRYRQLAHSIDNLGKGDTTVPLEVNEMTGSLLAIVASCHSQRLTTDNDVTRQNSCLPLFQIADQT